MRVAAEEKLELFVREVFNRGGMALLENLPLAASDADAAGAAP